ncbi:thymidylate synthase, partial [Pseudoalteromonas sp. SIMBA_153]
SYQTMAYYRDILANNTRHVYWGNLLRRERLFPHYGIYRNALLSLFGRLTGYTPRWFTYFIGDAHVYENHLDMLNEQLKREPLEAPKLVITDRVPAFAE